MKNLSIFGLQIVPAIYMPIVYFAWVSVFLVLKKLIFSKIQKFAQRTTIKLDDILVGALDLPLMLLIFVSGAFFIDKAFGFSADSELLKGVSVVFRATTIIAVIIFFDRLFKGLINAYARKVTILKDSGGVVHIITRSIVVGLGILILLDSFGVSITPVLASLGIGSLAVALALQPTLENFFSGIQIIIDRPITVGQYIRLESGEEGYVEKVGWRSTWVRQLPNNVVVIPNKVLVGSRVLNYHYPEKEMSVKIQACVHYDSDLDHVEKVTIEVGKNILKTVEGGVGEFEPFIRYHTFNDSSIDFTVILRVNEFVDSYLIKHEFIKALHKRFKEENITIPYPIRTLDWNDNSSPIKTSK